MCFADLAQRIAPGQWRTKHGRDFEGFPCQTTGNYCGVLILMYAFCTCTDAPFLFTELDMADIRKWWCISLMERFQIDGLPLQRQGKMRMKQQLQNLKFNRRAYGAICELKRVYSNNCNGCPSD
ncbi:unnamed protein product [Arctogadus glacialis]